MNEMKLWDLQLFAEGGSEGGAPAGPAEGGSNPAAPAVEEPALRPAEERQMRRSGQLKKSRAAAQPQTQPAAPAEQNPAAGETAGKGEAEGEKAAGESKAPAPGEAAAKEERKAGGDKASRDEFLKFLAENPAQSTQLLREIQAEKSKAEAKYAPLMKALAERYGTTPDDMDGIMDALKGPVKDDAYYNALAMQRGTSVENAKEIDRIETENLRLKRANQRSAQIAEQQRRAAQVQQIRAMWDRQAEAMKAKYPDFDFARERQNPDFASILRAGGTMEAAYRATHFDQLAAQVQNATAQQVEQGVVDRIAQRASRPAENGISPAQAGAVTRKDPTKLTAKECEELERQAARGVRITFD